MRVRPRRERKKRPKPARPRRTRRKVGVGPRAGGEDTRVRIDLDLPHELLKPSPLPVLRQIAALLREQEVEEQGSVLVRVGELLDELASLGFRRVDHWEVDPGGWLPLPEATHAGLAEPVDHLLRALKSPAWRFLAESRAFSVRLSAEDGRRADAVVLHLHREREHSITVDLWGPPSKTELRETVQRLRRRFSPLKVRLGT
ncbi:MAG TPA: hypothetical protein VEH10_06425 [Thermoplasmata archaeon]|nr:hypothetical protein [Thermoplasmata archaeon]